jgi:acetylornithine deacetylase/succinyl-diaminopimelate desuccinylase-like protein
MPVSGFPPNQPPATEARQRRRQVRPFHPPIQTGFTDSHFFRARGIPSYGYSPFLVPPEDDAGVHGNEERVSIENVRRGTRMMLELVRALVY